MNDLEITAYVVAPSIILLFGFILILISAITAPEEIVYVPPPEPRHEAVIDPMNDDTVVIEHAEFYILDDFDQYPQVGRRGLESVVRNQRVADDWWPPAFGCDVRVALLETPTAEYLFARKSKDQLRTDRTQFVPRYAAV